MNILYKVKTEKSFDEALDALKESLKKKQFGVLWELNFKDKLQEKGQDFDKNFKILEVCNPEKASQILNKYIEVGFFLPCKMVVYEDEGSVIIGMLNPTEMIQILDKEDLSEIALEVSESLIAAIEEAK